MSDIIATADGRVIPLSELEEKARSATPGPRWVEGDPYSVCFGERGDPRETYDLFDRYSRVDCEHIATFDRETCLALVAEVRRQAEEIASLRAECESHRNARRTLADDLVALGAGKPTVLELSRGADRRIAKLEAERDAALAELERCRRALVGDYVSAVVGVTSQEGAQMSMDAALAVLDEYGKENEGLNQRITILEAENTKLRRWLDDAEAELERLREAVAIEGETP